MAFSLTYGRSAEPLKGRPKSVRILQSLPGAETQVLQEAAKYRQDGLVEERSLYLDDGTLSYQLVYDYGVEGLLAKVTVKDKLGNIVQTMLPDRSVDGREREVFFDKDGAETHTTTAIFDVAAHTYTMEAVEPTGRAIVRVVVYHDLEQRPVRVHLKLGESDEVDIDLGTRGEPLLTNSFPAVTGGSLDIASLVAPNAKERVELRDEHGNWTRKSILSDSPDSPVKAIKSLTREITYY